MPSVKIDDVTITRGQRKILEHFSIEIDSGEYFALVGETGAGKTTILNLISGLLVPDSGRILIDGKDVTDVPAELRDTGMVFENYALFPHYNVYKNVTYSHRVRDRNVEETKKAAREVLSMVLIPNRDDALPRELSGGMQQRVAVARALMTDSGILLLDDPFSALDAGLRMSLRIELKNLARDIGTTVIHCTNDVEEAMMVANRLAIIKNGKIEQISTPDDIYYRPASVYAASFLGTMNLFKVKVTAIDYDLGVCTLIYQQGDYTKEFITTFHDRAIPLEESGDGLLCVRAEHVYIHKGHREMPNHVHGIIDEISFLGHLIRLEIVDKFGKRIVVNRFVNEKTRYLQFQKGEEVTLSFQAKLCLLFAYPGDEEFARLAENV
ncbi:MAG TPA: ABC transporter ATP-binding protein [Candidatus Lokiarchaeia archaeon]|nr:ABC transporter ATP-binding protein [Candidatus Lokiarchaeia archaeon]